MVLYTCMPDANINNLPDTPPSFPSINIDLGEFDVAVKMRKILKSGQSLETRKQGVQEYLDTQFEQFVVGYGSRSSLPEDRVREFLGNPELRAVFDEILKAEEITLSGGGDGVAEQSLNRLKADFKLKLSVAEGEAFDDAYGFSMQGRYFAQANIKLLSSRDRLRAEEYNRGLNRFDSAMESDEKFAELEDYIDKYVKESDDEELKTLWKEYNSQNYSLVSGEHVTGDRRRVDSAKFEKLTNRLSEIEAVAEAQMAFDQAGIPLKIDTQGQIKFREQLILQLDVARHEGSGDVCYFLKDQDANAGRTGPFTLSELADAIDARHIDTYLAHKIKENPLYNENNDISEIPDNDIVRLAVRIIGPGEARDFSLDHDHDRVVLDNLGTALLKDDPVNPSLYKKIEYLNQKILSHDDARSVYLKLAFSGDLAVSELI